TGFAELGRQRRLVEVDGADQAARGELVGGRASEVERQHEADRERDDPPPAPRAAATRRRRDRRVTERRGWWRGRCGLAHLLLHGRSTAASPPPAGPPRGRGMPPSARSRCARAAATAA